MRLLELTIFPHLKWKMLRTKVRRKWIFSAYTVFLTSDLFILADSLCAWAHGCSFCATCIYPGGFVPIKKGNVAKLMYLLQQENWIYWSHHGNEFSAPSSPVLDNKDVEWNCHTKFWQNSQLYENGVKRARRNLPPKLNQPFIPMMHQWCHEGDFHPVTKKPTWGE